MVACLGKASALPEAKQGAGAAAPVAVGQPLAPVVAVGVGVAACEGFVEGMVPGGAAAEEGGGGEPGPVHEVGLGLLVPGEAHGTGRRDFGGGDEEALAVDPALGLRPVAVGIGDLQPGRGLVVAGDEPAVRMGEGHAHGVALGFCRAEHGAGILQIGPAVGLGEGHEGQAVPHLLLLAGMDVGQVADVEGDGHAGVGDGEALGLPHPDLGQLGGLVAIAVRRQLHEVEREVPLAPEVAPAPDQGLLLLEVELAVHAVGFALVPDGAADGEGDEGVDHAVVEPGVARVGIGGQEVGAYGRHLGGELVLLGGGPRGHGPGIQGGQVLGQLLLVLLRERLREKHLVVQLLEGGHDGEALGRRPGLDAGAAPGGVDQPEGHLEFAMQVAAKEVERGGESRHGPGRADLPFGLHDVRLRRAGRRARHRVQPDIRVVGGGGLLLRTDAPGNGHLHVRLPRADPDFAHGDVGVGEGVLLAPHRQRQAGAHFHGGQIDAPFALGGGGGGGLLLAEGDGDLLIRARPTPHGQLAALLEHHVRPEDGGGAHVGDEAGGGGGEEEAQTRHGSHHALPNRGGSGRAARGHKPAEVECRQYRPLHARRQTQKRAPGEKGTGRTTLRPSAPSMCQAAGTGHWVVVGFRES